MVCKLIIYIYIYIYIRKFLDVVKEDMREVGAKETDVEDRKVWRMMIRSDHP